MEGLKAVKKEWRGFNPHLEVESDSLEVIKLINGVDSSLFNIHIFLEDIIFVGKYVNALRFAHVFHEENKVAYAFAILASAQVHSLI